MEREEYFGSRHEREISEGRTSKDQATNGEGRSLIDKVEENGFFAANGSINGNEEGEFIYVGARGKTTVD